MKQLPLFRRAFSLCFAAAFYLVSLPIALAQNTGIIRISCAPFLPGCGGVQINTGGYTNSPLVSVVGHAVSWLITIAGAGGILMGVVAGAMLVLSGGDEERRSKAIKTFIYAGAGILTAMFAYAIVELVNRLPFPGA